MNLSLDSRPESRARWVARGLMVGLLLVGQVAVPAVRDGHAQSRHATVEFPGLPTVPPLRLTCERLAFDHVTETFKAFRKVVVEQGAVRLTADQATLHKHSGLVTAEGHVHVTSGENDIRAETVTVNAKMESGTMTNGRVFLKDTNTWIRGRLFQRFSEMHYRAKDGMFTNCDAGDGQIPDWSFSFHDLDVEQGNRVFANKVWLNIRGYPIVPLPVLRYPAPGARQTGLLIPTVGFDNVFGVQYRQGVYWAASPSQDLVVTPQLLSNRGYGGDIGYRYVLDRRSRGNWLLNVFHDTDKAQTRAQITGAHLHYVNDDLLVQANINYATDRTLLQDLSASGTFRALPSQESVLNITQRVAGGNAYLKAQYLQPLDSGGRETFQRLPEIGYRYRRMVPTGKTVTLDVGMDSTFVHFVREKGFSVSRFDVAPAVSIRGLHLGHLVGFRPQFMVREVVYSRSMAHPSGDNPMNGDAPGAARGRGTFWLGLEAVTSLSRGFVVGKGHRLRQTMRPHLFYEYVPASRQSDLPLIDAIDNLPKKNLLTYALKASVTDEWSGALSKRIADFEVAQSYHLGDAPGQANTFSDVWARAVFDVPTMDLTSMLSQLRLSVDAFYATDDHAFTRLNSGIVAQVHQQAYVELGYRHTREGLVPRRGDIWNPFSFNEVLESESDIDFLTATAAVRLPGGWTVGTRAYHDLAARKTPEWDVVGLYQNPCKCWSLGLYYIRLGAGDNLPERNQVNVILTLRGVGATVGVGTRVLQSIIGPLLQGEPGLPWAPR